MFSSLSPQKVRHSSGYLVQVCDRYHVEYIEGSRKVKIEVDFGTTVGIYKSSLSKWSDGQSISTTDKSTILHRVSDALNFMGSKTEIC